MIRPLAPAASGERSPRTPAGSTIGPEGAGTPSTRTRNCPARRCTTAASPLTAANRATIGCIRRSMAGRGPMTVARASARLANR